MSTNPTPAPPIADPEDLLGTYAFLPWLRQGVANAITAPPAAGNRASIHVELDLLRHVPLPATHRSPRASLKTSRSTAPATSSVYLANAVIRTEPRAGVTNFESNYLAAVDFYDEDYPWRYTPAPPSGLQLSPWIALVVLKPGRICRREEHCQSSAALHHHFRSDCISASRRVVGVGARALQPGPVAESVDRTGFVRHERRSSRACRRSSTAIPTSRTRACSVRACWTSTPATTRSLFRRLRVDVSPAWVRTRQRRLLPSPQPGRPTAASWSRKTFLITSAGTSAPAIVATSAIWSACSNRSRSIPR